MRKWNDDGTVLYLHSECFACRRQRGRQYYADVIKVDNKKLKRERTRSRTWHRRNRRQRKVSEAGARVIATPRRTSSIPREPFAEWIKSKRKLGYSMEALSDGTKIPVGLLHAYLVGYDTDGFVFRGGKKTTRRKLRPVDHVTYGQVEKALLNWGESPSLIGEMYPEEVIAKALQGH